MLKTKIDVIPSKILLFSILLTFHLVFNAYTLFLIYWAVFAPANVLQFLDSGIGINLLYGFMVLGPMLFYLPFREMHRRLRISKTLTLLGKIVIGIPLGIPLVLGLLWLIYSITTAGAVILLASISWIVEYFDPNRILFNHLLNPHTTGELLWDYMLLPLIFFRNMMFGIGEIKFSVLVNRISGYFSGLGADPFIASVATVASCFAFLLGLVANIIAVGGPIKRQMARRK